MKTGTEPLPERHTAQAWVADPDAAKTLHARDLEAIQNRFNNRLAVTHTNDGSIVIYPECPGDRSEFDACMAKNGAFVQRPVRLNKL